jgi:hypothetical protein
LALASLVLFAEPIACSKLTSLSQVYTFDVRGADAPPKMAYLCHRPLLRALESAALKDEVQGPFPCAWHQLPLDPASLALRSKANKCAVSVFVTAGAAPWRVPAQRGTAHACRSAIWQATACQESTGTCHGVATGGADVLCRCVFDSKWHEALDLYNQLLERAPWFSQGYAARAICLLNRGWRGDAWAALRDADTCTALSPEWPKAYETRVRCLRRLGQVRQQR